MTIDGTACKLTGFRKQGALTLQKGLQIDERDAGLCGTESLMEAAPFAMTERWVEQVMQLSFRGSWSTPGLQQPEEY